MTPYYSEDGVTIYHGDCREILPSLELQAENTVTVTDPPYNLGFSYGSATDDTRDDYEQWCREWFLQCLAIAHLVAFTPGHPNLALWFRIANPKGIVAWHKPAAMCRGPFGFNNWEPVLVYGNSLNRKGVDVVTAPILPDPALDGHPCPKPLAWASGLIGLLSLQSEVIVDPFCGTGTTNVAATKNGRQGSMPSSHRHRD